MSQNESRGTSDPATIKVHPIAELFPLIEGQEFEQLVEDIRHNGLRTPILLHPDGQVLDGRNRLRACRAAGVEPRFQTWDGQGSALELVISLNLRRRHLNESQRAMLAARLKDKLAEEAARRRGTRTDLVANLPPSEFGKARQKAAALLNVSPRSVQDAARLLRIGDRRLIVLVESGKLAVSAAAEQLREAPSQVAPPGGFVVLHAAPSWEPVSRGRRLKGRGALPVAQIAAPDAVLFLRAPDDALAEAVKLTERWGFRYKAMMVWPAEAAGESPYTSERHDLLLIGVRGSPSPPAAPAGRAARAGIFEMIEQMFPDAPKADLYAARPRAGWSAPLAPVADAPTGRP